MSADERRESVLSIDFGKGLFTALDPEQETELLSAWRKWVQSGETIDTLLTYTTESGGEVTFRISSMMSVHKTTRETRLRAMHLKHAGMEEHRANLREAGFVEPVNEAEWT